jgi:hypothetical protein
MSQQGLHEASAEARSDLGMCKLFEMPHSRLQEIVVKGDLIISKANRDSM